MPGTLIFDADHLLETASRRCGLSDFGDPGFRPGLERFMRACREDGFVPEAGLVPIAESIVTILVNRLRFEAALRAHPEICDEKIVSPLFIIGPGRVGSTKLHRLMATAKNIQTTPLWQVMNPVPLPNAAAGEPDPRIAITEDFCTAIRNRAPRLYAAIEPVATAPDEDPYMLDMTFMQLMFLALANVPGYVEWIYRQDWHVPYTYHKKLLQYLQWQNGTSGKPMLLKGPSHTPHIDVLHEFYPDARFVQIHRDPVTCVASMGKVVWMLHGLGPVKGLDTVADSTRTQQIYMRHCLLENLRLRERQPDIAIADFRYEEVREDAAGLAQRIFEFWGVPLDAESVRLMRAWEEVNRQHRLGRFDYSIEESGVDPRQYEASIAPYMRRFFPQP